MDNELKQMIKEWSSFINNRHKKDKVILDDVKQAYSIALGNQDFEEMDKNYNKMMAVFKFENSLDRLIDSLKDLYMNS